MLFGLVRRSEPTAPSGGNHALAEAAKVVLETARRERWALVHIAECNEPSRPQYWFATNMLSIVTVRGRSRSGLEEALDKGRREGLTLSTDMNALLAAGEDEPRFTGLCVTAVELKRYLSWARTVQ